MHPDDEKLYADLLNLKDTSQKWIGIGTFLPTFFLASQY
jgi:hypothetical protein